MSECFRIELEGEARTRPENDFAAYRGKITIGEYWEFFDAPCSFWNRDDYLRQWEDGLSRIVADVSPSALVTGIDNYPLSTVLSRWVMYRTGETIFFRDQLILAQDLQTSFDPQNVYGSIGPRSPVTEDGQEISEWSLDVSAIVQFLNAGGLVR